VQKTTNVSDPHSQAKNVSELKTPANEIKARWLRCQSFKLLFNNRLKEKAQLSNKKTALIAKKEPKRVFNKRIFEGLDNTKSDKCQGLEPQAQFAALMPALKETESGLIIENQASCAREEINKLIKKMTLGFSVLKHESSFFMKEGLFAGTFFHLTAEDQNLLMRVKDGSSIAHQVLKEHEPYLQKRLLQHEINLQGIAFS
jgi:hypothetical protein